MATPIKYAFPSIELLQTHFQPDALWHEVSLQILQDNFVGKEFSERSLAQELVIWFPNEWRAVLDVLKNLIAAQTPMEIH
jgi:hypothetical protein